VTVQVIGEPITVPPPVARAVCDTVGAVLAGLPPHRVVLTALSEEGADTELYLAFGLPLSNLPDLERFGRDLPAAASWRARLTETGDGRGCLEVSWRQPGAGTSARWAAAGREEGSP
jgi:hypothetical protein